MSHWARFPGQVDMHEATRARLLVTYLKSPSGSGVLLTRSSRMCK